MTAHPTLFDTPPVPRARHSDPETSHEAAQGAARTAPRDRDRALVALREAGARGLTDFELGDVIGRQQTSAGKRRHELMALGLVEKVAGVRRASPSGAQAQVWRAV